MKKTTLLVIFVMLPTLLSFLGTGTAEAKRQPTPIPEVEVGASFYTSSLYPLILEMTPTAIDYFEVVQDGVVVLQDGVFIPQVIGILKTTVLCDTKLKEADVQRLHIRIILMGNTPTGTYEMVGASSVSFSMPYSSQPFRLEGWQEGLGGARSRCTVSVEKIK